ncbi:protein FAM83H-like [Myxocyprinus asiaticus]|uniref:protein FAM83H-like n=1 Tax=Myxocyprinus asiaticus TaxID=70543 RepID=UPI002221711A|nr:protein FAM83H-like [Myxocyprinus asiaticus]XP_051504312.1 protein FAM83H-like [Myxocyprinus asiaticus]
MAHRSQCSSAGDNPLDPNYLPLHYREEYRMAIDALIDADLEGYYGFLQEADVVDFLSHPEIEYIKCMVKAPHQQTAQPEKRYMAEDADGSSDTYWPVHSDHDAPSLDLGWPQQYIFVGPTEVTTLVNPSEPEMPSIKEQVRRLIKSAQQVVAVVMDMFTDVDIFADILGAAMRGVAVYILLDELNAHHFVAMVNNCRVNLDEIKFMRVRTVSGSTYFCRTGKSFKGQMMDRFILVDCRAVLSGNYSFMWSFEKIHRCLAHLFLGQLVTTFDEEFRILFAHSEPLVVENVLANMPHYSSEQGSYHNTDKTHMLKREYPTVDMEWTEYPAEGYMNAGHKMLPFRRGESIQTAVEENPSVQRHKNLYATQQFRGDHQLIEHGRQIKGPTDIASFKDVPNYEYMPPQNHATIRGKQYKEGVVAQGTHFAREPCFYQQGTGLQPGYDMYGRIRGQGYHVDQFSGSGYPHEGDEAGPPGDYDHVQRYLQSHSPMEEGHGARNLLPPVQSNLRRHNKGQSYACQTSPTQPNLPDQKRFFNVNHKPQDMSQKQGLRDWRISSYLSAYDDAGEVDSSELEGSDSCDNVPYFMQEGSCGPVGAKIRPGNREFNRISSSRENPTFLQIQNTSALLDSSVNHPAGISQTNIKTTPTTTSESSCNTEGGKVEETHNREPKETNLIIEEFHRKKPTRTVQSSRLRYSQIFNSNLELNTSEMKDTLGEKDGDETSKLSARVSHWLDKRRSSTREPFQWSSFARSATVDNPVMESAHSEEVLNKVCANSDVNNVENSQNSQKNTIKGPLQEKDLPEQVQSAVFEGNSQSDEWASKVFQRSTSFIDMNDPDCRLRYFKELAAKRKAELTAAKASQSDLGKSPQKSDAPEKLFTSNTVKKAGPVFKAPATLVKSSNATLRAPEKQETLDNPECGESREDLSHRATDAEKIRLKKKIAEESGSSTHILNVCIQKHVCDFSADPIATKSVHSQKTLAVGADIQHPAATDTDSSQQATAADTDSSQHPNGTDTDSSQHPSATDTDSFQHPSAKNTDSSQQATATDTDAPQQPSATESVHSQNPTAMSADSFKQQTTMGAYSFQQPNVAESEFSQHPTATGTDSFQQLTAMEEHSSQQPTAAESESSQQLTTMRTDQTSKGNELPQPPTATGQDSSKDSPTMGADSSQQPTATDTDSSQHPILTDTKYTDHPTATDTDSSQHPNATNTVSLYHPTAKDTDSSQHPTAIDTDAAQHPTATDTDSSQLPSATDTDSSQHPTATDTDPSQHPNATNTDSSQQAIATDTDSSQHPTATGTDSSQHPTATDTSQQCIAKDTDSTQHYTLICTDSSQHPNATNTDTSQHPTATDTDSSQQAIVTDTNYSQQPPIIDTDSSQHPAATGTDSSQHPTATDASQQCIAKDTDSSQHHSAIDTDPSQYTHATDRDSSQHPSATDIDPSQHTNGRGHILFLTGSVSTSILETNSEKILVTPVACTIQNAEVKSPEHGPADDSASCLKITLPIDTTSSETSLSQEPRSPNMNEQKDNRVCQVLSKQGPIPAVNITQTDSSISLNTIITDLGSSAEHSQSDSLAPCASLESSSNFNSDTAKPCLQSDDSQLELNSSPNHTQAQAKSPIPPVIKDTNSCENDRKPEKNKEIIDEQPQRHDTSARPAGLEVAEVSATPETENSVTDFAVVSEKSKCDLIVHNDAENQSSVTEKPKLILPTHQSSTANVLSFSNLRDDTKVLLEQISAKNQSRASQSKQTFETKEGEVNSADKNSGRPWSSKATAEDRAKLLQKMDVLRKERKVYSRFEAT